MRRWIVILPMSCATACLAAAAWAKAPAALTVAPPASALRAAAAWQPAKPGEVKNQVFAWLDATKADPALRAKVQAVWAGVPGQASEEDLLVRLAGTFAAFDSRAAKLLDRCSQPRNQLLLPREEWLRELNAPPLLANNLRLLYARWLMDKSLYDEASEQLAGLDASNVVAPALFLFCRGVVCHALLNKDCSLKSIDELLQGAERSPKRYVAVARLMQEDLKNLQEEGLDHIARRMSDIHRRLDLGRAGPKVRQVEDGVIESLDKLIKNIEQQQQQQSANSAESIRSTSPAQDSYLKGGKGPGDVTKRPIGSGSGWGDLPPKERDEALQQIGRDFPSHYHDVVEQYFRRLATEGGKP
jgi:hypothetical protein